MSNLVIYTDRNSAELQALCQEVTDFKVVVKSSEEIKEVNKEEVAIAVVDMAMDKLKEVSMVMKFPVPVLVIADEIPQNLTVRGEAFDYIVYPVEKYELSVRLKNLIKIKELKDKISNISTTDDLTGLHNRKFLL